MKFILPAALCLVACTLLAADASYEITDILTANSPSASRSKDWKPGEGIALEVSGMDFMSDGKLAVVIRKGEIRGRTTHELWICIAEETVLGRQQVDEERFVPGDDDRIAVDAPGEQEVEPRAVPGANEAHQHEVVRDEVVVEHRRVERERQEEEPQEDRCCLLSTAHFRA